MNRTSKLVIPKRSSLETVERRQASMSYDGRSVLCNGNGRNASMTISEEDYGDKSGGAYSGLFKITDTSDYVTPTYQVGIAAGYANVNAVWISCAADSTVAIPAGFVGADPDYGYIIAAFDMNGTTPEFDEYIIDTAANFLAGSADHAYVLLGRVKVVTGAHATIIQDQYGAASGYDIPGDCTT